MRAWRSFLKAHSVLTKVLEKELLATHRLPLAEYDVLVQLSAEPGGRLRMAQLADRVLLSRSGLTRLVERLEAAGLVRREVCASDARGYFAVITDQGASRLRQAARSHLDSVQRHFAELLTAEELECINSSLERVAATGEVHAGPDDRDCGRLVATVADAAARGEEIS